MIEYDRTTRSVVAVCSRCGAREVTTTQAAADTWTVEHLLVAHPAVDDDHRRAIRASQKRATRR